MDAIRLPEPFRVSLFVVEGFSMMALSAAIEPLRALNRLVGEARYDWALLARREGLVASSSGIDVWAGDFETAPPGDFTVVVASLGVEAWSDRRVFAWLRTRRRGRMSVGGVSNGALILARAGLLDERRATIHWEAQARLAEERPAVELVDALWCVDREVATAAGGAAAMDMMLALIAEREGRDLAADVSEQFLHGPLRDSAERQRSDVRWRYGLTDGVVVQAVRLMEARLASPWRVSRLAEELGLSERQFSRRFEAALGEAPSDFYLGLRLKHARRRLVGSADTLERIAEEAGFSSLGHFSRAFKAWTGEPPSSFRRRAVAGMSSGCKGSAAESNRHGSVAP